jgi:hypothetical protein
MVYSRVAVGHGVTHFSEGWDMKKLLEYLITALFLIGAALMILLVADRVGMVMEAECQEFGCEEGL